MNEDEKWMQIAIQEAIKAEKENEVPVGAVLVKDGHVIARAHNQSISSNDPTAHAEIQLIRTAPTGTSFSSIPSLASIKAIFIHFSSLVINSF